MKPSVILITYATLVSALHQLSGSQQCQVNGKKSVTSDIINDIFRVRKDKVCGGRSRSRLVMHLLFPRSVLTQVNSKQQISQPTLTGIGHYQGGRQLQEAQQRMKMAG